MKQSRYVLIGAAWPYANNSLHLGHVASLLPADIIARYHRQRGDKVLYVSGSDCHGTPITVTADKLGQQPKKVALRYHQEFIKTLIEGLGFSYDLYTKTMGEFHIRVVQKIFSGLYTNGWLTEGVQNLPYCSSCKQFRPDRYIEGTCPRCNQPDARGDQCDNCGSILDPYELINPVCKICGTKPEWRESKHYFLDLPKIEPRLRLWIEKTQGNWRSNARQMTKTWMKRGLRPRPITRDTSWGVPLPENFTGFENKSIYVWFEAVCGYYSASLEWAELQRQPDSWRPFWEGGDSLHYYVHGKDNIPFHTIMWPAILMGAGDYHCPDRIISSEYLQFGGSKVSKSTGGFYSLPRALENFQPDAIRYYLTREGPETKDSNFTLEALQHRVNGELIGTIANLVHRTLSLCQQATDGRVPTVDQVYGEEETQLWSQVTNAYDDIGKQIEAGTMRDALMTIRELAKNANRYLNSNAPWKTAKSDPEACTLSLGCCLNVVANLGQLMQPFLPFGASKLADQLGLEAFGDWQPIILTPNQALRQPQTLYTPIDDELVKKEEAFMAS